MQIPPKRYQNDIPRTLFGESFGRTNCSRCLPEGKRRPRCILVQGLKSLLQGLESVGQNTLCLQPYHPLAFDLPQRIVYKPPPSLGKLLIRSAVRRSMAQRRGCRQCQCADCPLHEVLYEAEYIESLSLYKSFQIRGALHCDSRHVAYVWTCSCGLQGVGQCVSPKARLPNYLRALAAPPADVNKFTCRISICALPADAKQTRVVKSMYFCE